MTTASPEGSPGHCGQGGGRRLTYAQAGVDIGAADQAVAAMAELVASTRRPEVLGSLGGFAGLCSLPRGLGDPVLVASTDGVGTKMAVATATGRYDTVGIDLVAMCVDDLVCAGASPLFFLDYQLLGKVEPSQVTALMTGIAKGCLMAGCAILGGELAEHPGLIAPGEVDLAGFAVGVVERDRILDGRRDCRAGDILVGLASPGLRSNGYSLARKALLDIGGRSLDAPAWEGAPLSLADELLRPSVIYSPAVLTALSASEVHAAAHVTGGGIVGNLARVLPPDLDAVVHRSRWETPRIFSEIRLAAGVSEAEMARVFNLGIGMILVVAPGSVEAALETVAHAGSSYDPSPAETAASGVDEAGINPVVIGELTEGTGKVHLVTT